MEAVLTIVLIAAIVVLALVAKGYRTNFHAEVDAHITTCQRFESYVQTSESATTSLNAVYLHDMQYLTDTLQAERWYATEQALRIVELEEARDLFWKLTTLSFGDIVLADQHARARETIEEYELEEIENPMVVSE